MFSPPAFCPSSRRIWTVFYSQASPVPRVFQARGLEYLQAFPAPFREQEPREYRRSEALVLPLLASLQVQRPVDNVVVRHPYVLRETTPARERVIFDRSQSIPE